ncbi:MAG: hypothetical protein JNJ59_09640, partial [Deltaproteobacteria bacterium]|nr:hypothetical protein [Deltaproteobacteria bacterium]
MFRDSAGKIFGAARALGGEVQDTVFGRRSVFTLAFSFERPRFIAGAWRLAEGRGFVDDVQAAIVPAPTIPPAPAQEARLALTPLGPELTGMQAVSVSAVAGAGPAGELAVKVGLIAGQPTRHGAAYACLLADAQGAHLESEPPDEAGAIVNVYSLVEGTSCSEAAVTRPQTVTGGVASVAVDVQGRRLTDFIAPCNPYGWNCFGMATAHLALFGADTDTVGLAVDLRTDATGTGGEVITSTRAAPAATYDPVIWRQDPTEFADGSHVRWREGLGFAEVAPARGIVRQDLVRAGPAPRGSDVLFLRRGRAETARLEPAVGEGSGIGLIAGRDGPLQIEPWSTTLASDGTRRVTTLSADGRVDEILWDGGQVQRRVVGQVAIPSGERGVGAVFDGERRLIVVTTHATEGRTMKQLDVTSLAWEYDTSTRFYRVTLPAAPAPLAPATDGHELATDLEVEGSGPDLRICSRALDAATLERAGWTLGGEPPRVLRAGPRCVVLVRAVPPPTPSIAAALEVRVPADAFLAKGTLPTLGVVEVAVRAVDPTPADAGLGSMIPPMMARGANDRGFADGEAETPRGLPDGDVVEVAGGTWR